MLYMMLLIPFLLCLGVVASSFPAGLKFLAPRCEEFRNLRKLFYLLLCSITPQQAAGNARAIVFTPMESRAAFYRDESFRKRMEWFFLPAIGFLLGLININLKYTLVIGGAAILLSHWVLRPAAETLIVEPLFRRYSKGNENGKTQNG